MHTITTVNTDREVLLTLLRDNKWDYRAYRESYGDKALARIKGITGPEDEILQQMLQNYDFTQDATRVTSAHPQA